ncbi:apolipoprotein D-like [Oreochromis aureus]|uniref:Apolipoprotein D n=1 Tax=Oreochromis aureus TaxID=47969 RepID=A0A668THR8_OREAU|nr:apolipoprotein D-like [Oreochromis aureus]
MSAVYLLLLLVPAISAQTFHWGACPTPNVQSNFTLQPYMGKWYEIEKLPDIFGRGQCIREENTMMEDGTVQVLYSQVWDPQNHQGKRWYLEGTAKVIDPQEPAKLGVNFMSFLPNTPYWVLSTDYTDYSIVYSCKDVFGIFYFDFAWILARSPSLPPQIVDQAKQMLINEGIDISNMTPTDQSCSV